ncbi:MAG: hypothetical protein KA354_23090 [Phycisphaerae bacterium]|nr:hypothetical protein [Phycisphaerae bacterium]
MPESCDESGGSRLLTMPNWPSGSDTAVIGFGAHILQTRTRAGQCEPRKTIEEMVVMGYRL